MEASTEHVAEIQGLYGPFIFSEKLLQRIWMRGEFNLAEARTTAGVEVEVIEPGRWNVLGGPDFKGAKLRLGGRVVVGDVELHVRAVDWKAHGHAHDSMYANVILHAVLFAGKGLPTLGYGDREIPVLNLLPLLLYSLEDYAADAVVERLADRAVDQAFTSFATLSCEERQERIRGLAATRWQQKVKYAATRVAKLGWDEACHQTALEILGYRFNRAPMLRIAGRWSLAAWRDVPALPVEAYASERGRWSVQGVRPANRPWRRLWQYAHWVQRKPHWPHQWQILTGPSSKSGAEDRLADLPTAGFRKERRLSELRREWSEELFADVFSGCRLDTLICNGLLPLVAVNQPKAEWEAYWFHWFVGDLPDSLLRTLRTLDLAASGQPRCHGWVQGVMQGWFEYERDSSCRSLESTAGRGAGA